MNIHEINDGLKDLNIKVIKKKRDNYSVFIAGKQLSVHPDFFNSDFNKVKTELDYLKKRIELAGAIESHEDYIKDFDGYSLPEDKFNRLCLLFDLVDLKDSMWRHIDNKNVIRNLSIWPYIEKELLIMYKNYRKKLNEQAS